MVVTIMALEIPTEVPGPLIRAVFGNEHARKLLLLLEERAEPVRYSRARDELRLAPEQFRRALQTLEAYAMIQYRAPKKDAHEEGPRNAVYLELSAMGRLFAELWRKMNADLAELMAEHNIPAQAFSDIAEG